MIRGGWGVLPALQRLTSLDLRYCGLADLRTVPSELASLTNLEALDLSSNRVAEGWHHLAACTRLTRLRLNNCGPLARLPPEWSRLGALRRLELRGTAVEQGTDSLQKACPLLTEVIT